MTGVRSGHTDILRIETVRLEDAQHDVQVLVESHSPIRRASSGSASSISDLLHELAAKLAHEVELTPDEQAFLAEGLVEVAKDIRRYGRPFGYQQQRGRPAKLTGWREFRVGLAVDRAHRPERYDKTHPPLPLESNSRQAGAYAQVAEQLGVSERTVRRAYEKFECLFPDESKAE